MIRPRQQIAFPYHIDQLQFCFGAAMPTANVICIVTGVWSQLHQHRVLQCWIRKNRWSSPEPHPDKLILMSGRQGWLEPHPSVIRDSSRKNFSFMSKTQTVFPQQKAQSSGIRQKCPPSGTTTCHVLHLFPRSRLRHGVSLAG